jgi:DNA-binding CsgD family transcriptional regulator
MAADCRARPTRWSDPGWDSLTRCERRVAQLVAEDLSDRAIADRLVVSVRTVESHIARALLKLGVRSRVGLAVEAVIRLDPQPETGFRHPAFSTHEMCTS